MSEFENTSTVRDFDQLDKVTGLTDEIVDSEHMVIAQYLQSKLTEDSFEDLNICFNRADNLTEMVSVQAAPNAEEMLDQLMAELATSNTNLSTESFDGIADLAKKFWSATFSKLNGSWDNVLEYMVKSESKVIYLESRIGEAIRSIEERTQTASVATRLDLGRSAEFLNWNGHLASPHELPILLNKVRDDASILLVERTALTLEYLHRIVGSLESILESRDIERVRNDLRNVAKFGFEIQKQTQSLRTRLTSKPFGHAREDGRDAWLIGNYIGGRMAVLFSSPVTEADLLGDGRTLMTLITQIFSSDILLERNTPTHLETTARPLTLKEAEHLLKAAEAMLGEVTRFNQRFHDEASDMRVEFRRLRHDLSVAGASADLKEFNLYLRRAAYAAQRCTQWMFNPYVPLTTFILNVAHAALIYAEMSIKTYPVK